MTSRQTGRRLSAMARQRRGGARRAAQGARRRKSEPLSGKDLRRLLQLVACGTIFVALVAAKLLLPARMAGFNARLSAAMERNMDVQAVFSAVGRAFSGEGVRGEVYQAVFRPQEEEPAAMRAYTGALCLREDGALAVLRDSLDPPQDPAPEKAGTPEEGAYVLYSRENVPEGVSMEQAILGFDYSPPLRGAVVSSDFGYREHPTEGEERFHYGVDLAADAGTEVNCFADGHVTAVGESSSYGRYCVVSHQGGYSTLYAHCSRITVSSGAEVRRGEKIAEVGQTGMATGPHLHFELQRQGDYLNPIYYVAAL